MSDSESIISDSEAVHSESVKRVADLLRLLAQKVLEHPELFPEIAFELPPIRKSRAAAKRPGAPLPARIDFDVFELFAREGEAGLLNRLSSLQLEVLRKTVSDHRLDPAGLTRRWRKKEKLIELIVTRVALRSVKGDSF